MSSETELIKSKIDIVDLLKSYITLIPAGKNFKAVCPFHQERTPSFIISPEKQIWHCFGSCGDGGDVIKFAMKYENLDFYEALRFLAEKAGIPLPSLNFKQDRELLTFYDIYEVAKNFYKSELIKNLTALNYLQKRGLKKETLEEFEIGLSPYGDELVLHLIKEKFNILDAAKAGLVHKNIKGMYQDRFAGRIIFPIYNHLGRVVAFTGRILNQENENQPKYLNSPETPIFNKSKVLYGLHKSKNEISKLKTVFIVEGQMDFLMSYQSGIKNIVAISGTGLTAHHLERLRRMADVVILSFDNDEAGIKAMERSLNIFNGFDFHVRAINLGNFKDPAEALLTDSKYLEIAIKEAKPVFENLFNHYFSGKSLEISQKKRIIKELLLKIREVQSKVEQDIWIKELSRKSGVSETALFLEMESLPAKRENESRSESSENNSPSGGDEADKADLISKRLLILSFAFSDFFSQLKERADWLKPVYKEFIDNPDSENSVLHKMKATHEIKQSDSELFVEEFNHLMKNLELEYLKTHQMRLKNHIQTSKTEEEKIKHMNEYSDLSRRLNNLKGVVANKPKNVKI